MKRIAVLQMFGKVVGRNEGQDMRFQALEAVVMQDLHGRIIADDTATAWEPETGR